MKYLSPEIREEIKNSLKESEERGKNILTLKGANILDNIFLFITLLCIVYYEYFYSIPLYIYGIYLISISQNIMIVYIEKTLVDKLKNALELLQDIVEEIGEKNEK